MGHRKGMLLSGESPFPKVTFPPVTSPSSNPLPSCPHSLLRGIMTSLALLSLLTQLTGASLTSPSCRPYSGSRARDIKKWEIWWGGA